MESRQEWGTLEWTRGTASVVDCWSGASLRRLPARMSRRLLPRHLGAREGS